MEYVNFGKAGVKVSRIALGLGFRGQNDPAEAQKVVERAIDLGITFFDCANVYGPTGKDAWDIGHSERILGRVIKSCRDDVVITTKVAGAVGTGPNESGLSRYHIMQQVERSLKHLETDYIDVYLAHDYPHDNPHEETLRTFDDLVRSGKVLYVGCCNYDAWQVCHALWIQERINASPYICVQNPYNLLNRKLEHEMFGVIREFGLGAMAYSPLAVGLLSGAFDLDKPAPADSLWGTVEHRKGRFERLMQGPIKKTVALLYELATEIGKTPAQLAMSWVLSHPEITTALSGSDKVEHVEDVVGGVDWELDPDIRKRLDEQSKSLGEALDG